MLHDGICAQTCFLKYYYYILKELAIRLKGTEKRPWVSWNCPATDETFPPGCVTQPLGRSWVLSQFANSVLSFVTVELLITIPHSSPPSHLPSRPLVLLPSQPSRSCNKRSKRFRHLCSHSFSLFLSASLLLRSSSLVRAQTPRILPSYLLGKGTQG